MKEEKLSWTTVQRKVNDLIPFDKNARTITESDRMKMIESLQRFNLVDIPVIDADNTIISGHQRLYALQAIGRGDEEIDVRLPSRKLAELELKEYNLLANTHYGKFDIEMYQAFFADVNLDIIPIDISKIEFEQSDAFENIKNKFEKDTAREAQRLEAKEDDFDVPEGGIETDIVLGDLFEIGEHRLLCGDSTDSDQVAKLMNGEKADMVFTDPPYGVDYKGINNDNRSGLKELLQGAFSNYIMNSKNGASVYCFHSDKCSDIFNEVFRSFCHFSSMIIWVKESIVLSQTDYQSKHEPCFYGWFDNGTHKWYSDRKQESVWIGKSKREEGHTTPKPIEIVSKGINNSSETNHLVLDLFLGSGSTMVASHQLKRKCYGMELDPKYCQVIVDRMRKLDPEIVIKRNGIII